MESISEWKGDSVETQLSCVFLTGESDAAKLRLYTSSFCHPAPGDHYENVGSFTRSSCGTGSSACPAFRQAASPPTITNALNPFSRSRCATRALVASRAQVQYR